MRKRINKWQFITILFLTFTVTVYAQRSDLVPQRCATDAKDSIRILANPRLVQQQEISESRIQEYLRENRSNMRLSAEVVVTIPVVVHVIHNQKDNRIGGANNRNISDEQIRSQIDILNEDYGNTSGYKGFYTDSLGVDTGIRFRLAGVVRKYDSRGAFNIISADQILASISPPWATNKYLNIWVCDVSSAFLGVAQSPVVTEAISETAGLPTTEPDETNALTDGVIIGWQFFGRNSEAITSRIYNLGRTTTHEVGHWLGLIHTWGTRSCGTDYCDDTPRAENSNNTQDLSCKEVISFCDGYASRNMIENYMDYSPDRCMSIFTNDQKRRMHAVLAVSPRRAQLVQNATRTETNLLVDIFPNPITEYLKINVYTPNDAEFRVSVINVNGVKILEDIKDQTFINVKNFSTGIYFLKVSTDQETVTKRFLVR